jgi:lipoprotein-releasing system ATP-binding protein
LSRGRLLELRGITREYHVDGGPRLNVLRGVDLEVRGGEMVAVTGPSGSGKSTLLNIIGTLDRPDSGTFFFKGHDVLSFAEGELLEFRRRAVGFVFQSHHLLPYLTVLENTLVPSLLTGDGEATGRARGLLERVGLSHRLDHRPGALSVGERQRAAVVRALVGRPELVLADEPTGSLDREGSERLGDLLVELNREEGTALVMVTHSVDLAGRAGRVLSLRDGLLSPATAA